MEIITNSTEETKRFAIQIAQKVRSGDVLALYGDLGSGKTTFTSYLVNALGIDSRVQSPTFVILRKYQTEKDQDIKVVNHIDLYRMNSREEVIDLGLEEITDERNSVTVIEWPEIAEGILKKETINIYFEYFDDEKRKIRIQD